MSTFGSFRSLTAGLLGRCAVMLLMAGVSTAAHAEFLGLPSGRTVPIETQPQIAIEAGYLTGEIGKADYQHMGLRLNYKLAPNILAFGDLGQSEVGSGDEASFGAGVFYGFGTTLLGDMGSAVKLSIHQTEYSSRSGSSGCAQYFTADLLYVNVPGSCRGGTTSKGQIRNFALEFLIGSEISSAVFSRPLHWYSNAGLQLLHGGRYDKDIVLGLGGGLILPLPDSEAYAGLEYIDGLSIGMGFRYFIQ